MPRRMTRRSTRALLLAAIAAGGGTANANAPPLPEDFLEYLGSWEADDADWAVANAIDPRAVATPASNAATPDGAIRPTTASTTTVRGTSTATPAPGTERKP
jgi:hypothetical protein